MSPHYWIEVQSVKKIALFVFAVAAIAVFWSILPAEIKEAFRGRQRRVVNLPAIMFIG